VLTNLGSSDVYLVVAPSEEWTDAAIAGSAIILVGSDQTGSMPKRAISARP
jgi:hypothetical protein